MDFIIELDNLIELENRYLNKKKKACEEVISLLNESSINNIESITSVRCMEKDNIEVTAHIRLGSMLATIVVEMSPLGQFSARLISLYPYISDFDGRVNTLSNIIPMMTYANIYLHSFNTLEKDKCLDIYSKLFQAYKIDVQYGFLTKLQEFVTEYKGRKSPSKKRLLDVLGEYTNLQELYRYTGSFDQLDKNQFLDKFIEVTKAIISNKAIYDNFQFIAEFDGGDSSCVEVHLVPKTSYLSYFDTFDFKIRYAGVDNEIYGIYFSLNYKLKTQLKVQDLSIEEMSNYFIFITKISEMFSDINWRTAKLKEHKIVEAISSYNTTVTNDPILKFCSLLELKEKNGL